MEKVNILFPNGKGEKPIYDVKLVVKDMNLDRVFDAAMANAKGGEDLKNELREYFLMPLKNFEDIKYRQDIYADLEKDELFEVVSAFSDCMAELFEKHSSLIKSYKQLLSPHGDYLKKGELLDIAKRYASSIIELKEVLDKNIHTSEGLKRLKEYLNEYVAGDFFQTYLKELEEVKENLSKVKYTMLIANSVIRIRKAGEEREHSKDLAEIFRPLAEKTSESFLEGLRYKPYEHNVEVLVAAEVAKIFSKEFKYLNNFLAKYTEYFDECMMDFAKNVHFYIAWIKLSKKLSKMGLDFCMPKFENKDHIIAKDAFDIALAVKKSEEGGSVIPNDVLLNENERIIVVSGPNQGGKSTFARTFGQLNYLSLLGLKVPGKMASLFIFDRIYTHFDREEEIKDSIGKLKGDLNSVKGFLDNATNKSIIIMNEIFSSTILKDAIYIGKQILSRIEKAGCVCLFVTFLDEMADFNEKTVSMVSLVDEKDPSKRTFRIVRKKADGLAYAVHIAQKYSLTYDMIKERLEK